jgi:heat shock protein HslJ
VCKALLVLAGVFVAVLSGCGGDDDEPASLAGTSWVLTEGVSVPQDVAVTMPTAAFTATLVSGTTGCNLYGGSYSVDGDELQLGALAMSQRACTAPADAVEAEFVATLADVRRWSIDGANLVLAGGDGTQLLRFESAPTG